MVFGNKKIFAIEYVGCGDGTIEANIFVAGQNITPNDNVHYDQYLVHGAIGKTITRFSEKVNWQEHECELEGDSVSEKFALLWNSMFWLKYEVFNWAPCTREYSCAVVAHLDKLYLCCVKNDEENVVYATPFQPLSLVQVLLDSQRYIVEQSKNPCLKLEIDT